MFRSLLWQVLSPRARPVAGGLKHIINKINYKLVEQQNQKDAVSHRQLWLLDLSTERSLLPYIGQNKKVLQSIGKNMEGTATYWARYGWYSHLLGKTRRCCNLLVKIWKVLPPFGQDMDGIATYWKSFEGIAIYWARFGKYWNLLGKIWKGLPSIGKYMKVQPSIGLGSYYHLLGNIRRYCHLVGKIWKV